MDKRYFAILLKLVVCPHWPLPATLCLWLRNNPFTVLTHHQSAVWRMSLKNLPKILGSQIKAPKHKLTQEVLVLITARNQDRASIQENLTPL
jgi:hypothetical protein